MEKFLPKSIIAKRAFTFALDIITLTKLLKKDYANIILFKQIVRSATSIGANIGEVLGANSKKDFIHCTNIAKKEAREIFYWLKLLSEISPDEQERFNKLVQENFEIVNMLTSIVKTAGKNL